MAVAELIEVPTKIVRRTVATDAAIPYGTVMKLGDDNTVTATGADTDPFGGICMFEKVATDTDILSIPCAMDGVWDIDTNGAVSGGEMVSIHSLNTVAVSSGSADTITGGHVGQAEETGDGSGGKVRVRCRG